MKRILSIYVMMFMCATMFAQNGNINPTVTMAGSGDTLTDTGSDTVSYTVTGTYKSISIQPVVTKISGTIGGTAILYGSLDNVTFIQLNTDTLKMTNVTTNTKEWIIDSSPYHYYMVVFTGTGTMAAKTYGYLYASYKIGTNSFRTFTGSGDTCVNTATIKNDFEPTLGYSSMTIQPVVTKISGTAAGTVTLQGSNDGVNYVTVNTSYISGGSATMSVSNVTTNTRFFIITGNPYHYYRLSYTGSGTMACKMNSYFLFQR